MRSLYLTSLLLLLLVGNRGWAQITQIHYTLEDDSCYRAQASIRVDSITGGVSPYSYVLADTITMEDGNFENLSAGLFELIVTDSLGSSLSELIVIESSDTALVEFQVSPITGLEDGFIRVGSLLEGPNPLYYTINNVDTFSDEYRVPEEGDYTIRTIAENACISETQASVRMASPRTENFFSPNNDGINDTWSLSNLAFYPNNKVVVYNRFGQRVFGTKSYQNDWDGKQFGQDLAEGTYYFVFYYDFNDDAKGFERGFVEIIR